KHPHIFVPRIDTSELIDALYNPISRDGAGMVEVGIHVQKALGSIAAAGNASCRMSAYHYSQLAFKRAKKVLIVEEDIKRISKFLVPRDA
ncbi:MAG TPA: hypothetical protein VIN07_12185, partial [Flavipsychrobacter sp.]